MSNFYFFYQPKGGEDGWQMALSTERAKVINSARPVFTTVLDLSSVPEDNDWTKVRYQGPFYADFDAGDDLPFVCEQFKTFIAKLFSELDFDVSQARLYASGGKGFHIEIPEACFMPKIPTTGTAWLPYIYREVAQSLIVDTLDLSVYTGKRGRMWRTAGIKRESGKYKVPITLEEALAMDADLYAELVSEARPEIAVTPPSINSRFAMRYEAAKERVVVLMRTKKKRQAKANEFLDPWKKAGKTPPTVQRLMNGEDIAEGAGFQQLSMQLAIYATSVQLELGVFLDKCAGLCANHVSDSYRYNTEGKRREELARMFRYMQENSLYDFDVGPLAKLTRPGVSTTDLGVVGSEEETSKDEAVELDEVGDPVINLHKGIRKGLVMNKQGMFKMTAEGNDSICKGYLDKVEAYYGLEKLDFRGYAFDIIQKGFPTGRALLTADVFTSAVALKKFFAAYQLTYQGGEPETSGLLDIMAERANNGCKVYVYPREGFFFINHPDSSSPDPVAVYLTQDTCVTSVDEDTERKFTLRYTPVPVTSSYLIDIHKAPPLDEEHKGAISDLFKITSEVVLADLLGWFVAAHFRSAYLLKFNQFPSLQVYGEAGAGKTATVAMLARLHWYTRPISIRSAMSPTFFAMDANVSTSTSAPLILDEYKPREMRTKKGAYEKVKEVIKMAYVGGDVGDRGTVNRGAVNGMAMISSKATAPVVFMGEAIEVETAIVERSVNVQISKALQTHERVKAFKRLGEDTTAISAIGHAIVRLGFNLNLEGMVKEMRDILEGIRAVQPTDGSAVEAQRPMFNRAVIVHGLRTLRRVLNETFGSHFDETVDALIEQKMRAPNAEESQVLTMHSMSELSKVLRRISLLSHEVDLPYEMRLGKDYVVGNGWVEVRLEKAYDNYRKFCASIHDAALFDTIDSFIHAFSAYHPCTDKLCSASELRNENPGGRVVRLDLRLLKREGVPTFRMAY